VAGYALSLNLCEELGHLDGCRAANAGDILVGEWPPPIIAEVSDR
jgi:hypothetical protein